MTPFNALVVRGFDLLLSPLQFWPPLAGLSLVSLFTAVSILLVVRATSNQAALAAAKRQIHGDLLEMRLFNDDLRAMIGAQIAILRHNAAYLRLSLVPMLWAALPLTLLVVHLQGWFGYTGVDAGQPVIVTAHLTSPQRPDARLEAAGIRVEANAVWFPSLQEVVWRVVPDTPGDHILGIDIDGHVYGKTLHVSDGVARRSPLRPKAGILAQFFDPSEAPMPASAPISRISVRYPERALRLGGWDLHWMAVYVTLSLLFALALKKPLGVTL